LKSSSAWSWHIIQSVFGWTKKCLTCSIIFVFSLSTRISHAKNFSLGVHLNFQTQEKVMGGL
jgi:hypothetical protein